MDFPPQETCWENGYFRIKLLLFQTSKELRNMPAVSLNELTTVSDLHADKWKKNYLKRHRCKICPGMSQSNIYS